MADSGAWARVARGVLVVLAVGAMFGATYPDVSPSHGGTLAGIFGTPFVNFTLSGTQGVHGIVGGDNFAPGDRSGGTITLSVENGVDPTLFDLDIGTTYTQAGGVVSIADSIWITVLVYGTDDLLAPPGRSELPWLDADQNGRVSLAEFRRAVRDLPTPASRGEGGTPFAIEVEFLPPRGSNSEDFNGGELDLTFLFHLADTLAPDLGEG